MAQLMEQPTATEELVADISAEMRRAASFALDCVLETKASEIGELGATDKGAHEEMLYGVDKFKKFIETFDLFRPYSVRAPGMEKTIEFITMDLTDEEVAWLEDIAKMKHVSEHMYVVCLSRNSIDSFNKDLRKKKLYGDLARQLLSKWQSEEQGEKWIWIWDTHIQRRKDPGS